MKFNCKSESDLIPAAQQLFKTYPDSRVFAFYGKMGAGKTTFIKTICKELGAIDIVQSPSFAIIHEYKTSTGQSLFHFDFYRVKNINEVYDIGYEDYFYSGNYCFIEWPEMIEELLPEHSIRVLMKGEQDRWIEF